MMRKEKDLKFIQKKTNHSYCMSEMPPNLSGYKDKCTMLKNLCALIKLIKKIKKGEGRKRINEYFDSNKAEDNTEISTVPRHDPLNTTTTVPVIMS